VEKCGRLFHGLNGIPDDTLRSGNEEVTGVTLSDFVNRVHAEGAICIAAHVDSQQGIRHHFRQTGREVIRLLTFDEQSQETQEQNLSNELKEYLLVSVLTRSKLQNHCTKDITVGSRQSASEWSLFQSS